MNNSNSANGFIGIIDMLQQQQNDLTLINAMFSTDNGRFRIIIRNPGAFASSFIPPHVENMNMVSRMKSNCNCNSSDPATRYYNDGQNFNVASDVRQNDDSAFNSDIERLKRILNS